VLNDIFVQLVSYSLALRRAMLKLMTYEAEQIKMDGTALTNQGVSGPGSSPLTKSRDCMVIAVNVRSSLPQIHVRGRVGLLGLSFKFLTILYENGQKAFIRPVTV